MYHSYSIGTNVVNVHGKILDSENFANLINDAQFAKNFPNNDCKYGKTTTKDLSSDSPNIPHYLLYQQQFAKIQPLHFSHVQCPETNSYKHVFLDKFICIG